MKGFKINFRRVHLEALLEQLRKNRIEITMEIEEYKYGKYAHIMDPNGIKIELWESCDKVFTKMYRGKTTL